MSQFSSKSLLSDEGAEEKYLEFRKEGHDFRKNGKIKHAVKAYILAAKFADEHELEHFKVIGGYEESAKLIIKSKPDLALACYQKAISVYIKNGFIFNAIECCFQYGYKIAKETWNSKRSKKLYNRGDELRAKNQISHSCVLTNFNKHQYGDDLYKVLEDLEKFEEDVEIWCSIIYRHKSFCRNCIKPYHQLRQYYIKNKRKSQDSRRIKEHKNQT
ncbi:hypothetical protein RF11_13581 [Thelohanellus kitauei]|uniref:Uncharacterized protein n=1 Tax=Thelohanellus kitauei TaxID=669202 RepID=A0A0C2NG86_THEKT|nr:hypothetical protein RF11_13581 [Thelohanellus kitauei]